MYVWLTAVLGTSVGLKVNPGALVRLMGSVVGVKDVDAFVVVLPIAAAEAGVAAHSPSNRAASPLNKVTRKVRFIISTPHTS